MSRNLTVSDITLRLDFLYKNVVDGSEEVKHDSTISISNSLESGTDADQADRLLIAKGQSLTGTDTLDLYDLGTLNVGGGAGKDTLGQTCRFSEIVMVVFVSASTSTGDLLIGGSGASNAWNSLFNGDDDAKTVLKPDGMIAWKAPGASAYGVTNTNNHVLQLEASGGSVDYDVYVIGRSP